MFDGEVLNCYSKYTSEDNNMEKKLDLRIVKTHKALYDAFSEMLCEKKFEDITINELCERAMVRRATFYKHFEDKYDFFAYFVRNIRMQLSEKIPKTIIDENPSAYYFYIFKEFFTFLNEHKALVNTAMNSSVMPGLLDILSDEIQSDIFSHLKEEKDSGVHFPMSIHVLAAFYAGGIIQITREKLTSSINCTDEELFEQYNAIISSFHQFR